MIKLTDRSILALKGKDMHEFLQSTITQDIKKLTPEQPLYGAILSAQGRFLFDFFLIEKDDYILLDCHKNELMEIAKTLHSYVLGKDIEFHDMSDDYVIFAALTQTQNSTYFSYPDPRLSEMGTRILAPKTAYIEETKKLEDYTQHRIKLGVVDGAYDGLKNRTLANELSLDFLNGVSFDKGCYVGQELTVRTKHRTEAKKRVYIASGLNEIVENGTPILKGSTEAGWIFSQSTDKAIVVIRTRYFGETLTVADQEISLEKPSWAGY